MKVLYIGHDDETDELLHKLMGVYFYKIKLSTLTKDQSLVEKMTTEGPFSFIVIALDNKARNAFELYNFINETIGVRPFIFFGSTASIKSQIHHDILQSPQTNFILNMPINPQEFKRAVNDSIEWVKHEEFEETVVELDKELIQKMKVRNFYLFDQLPYDVYLELTQTKFGKIISKNKQYSHQLVQSYAKKNIKHFYVKKDDQLLFLDTSIKNLIKLYQLKITEKKKLRMLHLKSIFFIQQFIKVLSVTAEIITLTNLFIDSTRDTVKSCENIRDLLNSITEHPNMTFAEHSLATAYICESMLNPMGWGADMSRDKLILASVLQDIALSNDEMIKIRSINDPIFKELPIEEQAEFMNHPQKAAKIASYFNGFSDVDFILNEHHEHPSGEGFPNGLNSSGLTTISCIFIIANNFASRMAQTPYANPNYSEIMSSMKRIYNTGNFKAPLKALEKTFKK